MGNPCLLLAIVPLCARPGRMNTAHAAEVRPAGVSSGQYKQTSGALLHSQPTAIEREQANAKILSGSDRTASPNDSDPARYHGSGWTGHVSPYGATASRKGLNCHPD